MHVENVPSHSQCALLRILTCKRQPRNVQGMRKCSKSLRPNHAKVAHTTELYPRKDAVEDVSEEMAEHSQHDCFSSAVAIYHLL